MIDAMVAGELIADPIERVTTKGEAFVTATLRVPAGAETIFVGIAAFDLDARDRLARLRKGSSVAAVGRLEATEWTSKEGTERKGWRLTAIEVLSVQQARQRRRAATGDHDE